jgi:1-aminocyclopropane-1-carboxylate deaminase
LNIPTQQIPLQNTTVQLFMRREDLIHPYVSGNKFRKLKYNLHKAKAEKHTTLLTFGGAFSNHIAAVAFAGKENSFETIGIIRGDELENKIEDNPTLQFAKQYGMQFLFISREEYQQKNSSVFIEKLQKKYGRFYLIPEGGSNELAVKGCEEINNATDNQYDYIACCVGTGTTIAGIINASCKHQKILGFPALKGDFLKDAIRIFAKQDNWDLITNYHFGGYAKINESLVHFMNEFSREYKILLDPIYTAKMVFGIMDRIQTNYFPENSKILMIHSGGVQGIAGMNLKLKQKKLPLINTHV